ncbi:hypothetical protein K1719_019407 [Acacia pycnantha]|nr:hypothetical protein K1719_019407 [Acacia pycnantha]
MSITYCLRRLGTGDCAQAYYNQVEIGSALKKLFDEGVVKREDLWITSKLWCSDHAPEDYLDLYLIHWPVRMKKGPFKPENLTEIDIGSTWRVMEAAYDAGKARAIGVSNFSKEEAE